MEHVIAERLEAAQVDGRVFALGGDSGLIEVQAPDEDVQGDAMRRLLDALLPPDDEEALPLEVGSIVKALPVPPAGTADGQGNVAAGDAGVRVEFPLVDGSAEAVAAALSGLPVEVFRAKQDPNDLMVVRFPGRDGLADVSTAAGPVVSVLADLAGVSAQDVQVLSYVAVGNAAQSASAPASPTQVADGSGSAVPAYRWDAACNTWADILRQAARDKGFTDVDFVPGTSGGGGDKVAMIYGSETLICGRAFTRVGEMPDRGDNMYIQVRVGVGDGESCRLPAQQPPGFQQTDAIRRIQAGLSADHAYDPIYRCDDPQPYRGEIMASDSSWIGGWYPGNWDNTYPEWDEMFSDGEQLDLFSRWLEALGFDGDRLPVPAR